MNAGIFEDNNSQHGTGILWSEGGGGGGGKVGLPACSACSLQLGENQFRPRPRPKPSEQDPPAEEKSRRNIIHDNQESCDLFQMKYCNTEVGWLNKEQMTF